MFDGVFNHASSKSGWFQRFLNGEPGYRDFFVAFSTREALSPDYLRLILRPRTSDLLTLFHGLEGPRYVWTTFGPDQVDLNFRNERVLLRIVEILLLYVRRGASLIRLDAITYVWRSLGTSCALLEETHVLVQLFRTILDIVSPRVALITETNVPHEENVRYLGDGINEAQLVYNFALPPLVLHTFQTGSSRRLTEWARSLPFVSRHATYFNFLASHDGIGLLGARGILTDQEIDDMVRRTEMNGGLVSYRSNGDGSSSPYELNVTWWSALNPEGTADSHETQVARLLAARAVALSLMGVPGVYFPTLFGAKNDLEAVTAGAEKRAINRKTIDEPTLRAQLADAGSHSSIVARGFTRLLRTRISQPAFHPNARQHVLDLGDHVFGVLRQPETGPPLLAVINVTDRPLMRELRPGRVTTRGRWRDALSERTYPADPEGRLDVELKPYGVRWLIPD